MLTFAGKSLSFTPFAALMLIVALCYGRGFGTTPAFTADYFGAKFAGAIYGTMLTAWSVGGILGPILIAQVKDRAGGYTVAIGVIAVVMLACMLLPTFTHAPQSAESPVMAPAQARTEPRRQAMLARFRLRQVALQVAGVAPSRFTRLPDVWNASGIAPG